MSRKSSSDRDRAIPGDTPPILPGSTMSKSIRFVAVGLILASGLLGEVAWCKAEVAVTRRAAAGGHSPSRGRPGSPSESATFDVKHIKAELTLDPQEREVRGTVTHTLTPLHPYLNRSTSTADPSSRSPRSPSVQAAQTCTSRPRASKLSITLDRAYGPTIPSTWRSNTPGSPEPGSTSCMPTRPIPRSPWPSGPRARPRTRTTGSPATTIRTIGPPPR